MGQVRVTLVILRGTSSPDPQSRTPRKGAADRGRRVPAGCRVPAGVPAWWGGRRRGATVLGSVRGEAARCDGAGQRSGGGGNGMRRAPREEVAECDAPLALGWRLPDHVAFAVIRWWLNRLLTKEKATQVGKRHPTDLDVFTKGPTFGRETPLKRVTATQRRRAGPRRRRNAAGKRRRAAETAAESGNCHPTAALLCMGRRLPPVLPAIHPPSSRPTVQPSNRPEIHPPQPSSTRPHTTHVLSGR